MDELKQTWEFNVFCLNNLTSLGKPVLYPDDLLNLHPHEISWDCRESQQCPRVSAMTGLTDMFPSLAVMKGMIWLLLFGWGRAETRVGQQLSVVLSTLSGLSSSSSLRVVVLVAWYKQEITADGRDLCCGKHLYVVSEWMCVWVNRRSLAARLTFNIKIQAAHLNTRGKKKANRCVCTAALPLVTDWAMWLRTSADVQMWDRAVWDESRSGSAGRASNLHDELAERERERVISRVISVSAPSPSQHTRLLCECSLSVRARHMYVRVCLRVRVLCFNDFRQWERGKNTEAATLLSRKRAMERVRRGEKEDESAGG